MRKTLLTFILLLVAALWTQVAAANYDLYIGGTRVTDANKSDILGNGNFSYDPSTKILFVKHGTVYNNSSGDGIRNFIDGLQVRFNGNATINVKERAIGTNAGAMMTVAATKGYTATIKSSNDAAVFGSKGRLEFTTISGGGSFVLSGKNGIEGYQDGCDLQIGVNCDITINATSSAFSNVKSFTDNGALALPSEGYFDESSKKLLDVFGNIAKTARFVPKASFTNYSIWVGGVRFNNYNYMGISNSDTPAVIGGTISYSPGSKVVNISADIDMEKISQMGNAVSNAMSILQSGTTLNFKESDLKINSKSGSPALWLPADVTITTPCSSTSTVDDYDAEIVGIWSGYNHTVTFNNARVKASYIYAYTNNGDQNKIISTGNKTMVITNSISEFASVTNTSPVRFAYPLGVTYHSTNKCLWKDGKKYTGETIIGACTEIPIYFGEEYINTIAAFDLLGDGSRDIRYQGNSTTGTIYMDNASFKNTGTLGTAINNRGVKNLTIDITGENKLTGRLMPFSTNSNNAINTTIKGSGTLTLESLSSEAVYMTCGATSNLTIEDVTVNVIGTMKGMVAKNDNIKMTIKDATLDVEASETPIDGFHAIEMEGCDVAVPLNGYCENGKIYAKDGQEVETGHVLITDFDKYGITIGGTAINEYNADDVLGDGKVYYNASSQELVLTDLKLTKSNYEDLSEFTIQGGDDNTPSIVTIRLQGENKIEGEVGLKWLGAKSVTLTGDGSLSVKAMTNAVIIDGGNLTVMRYSSGEQGPTVSFASLSEELPAVVGLHGDEALSIDGCRLEMSSNVEPLKNFGTLNMDNVYLISPKGAVFDYEKHCFVDANGDPIKGKTIVFRPEAPTDYGFDVAGVDVDEMNADDITGEGIKEGKVSFDATTNTLTLDGVTMSAETGGLNIAEFAGTTLTVKLIGENKCENEETAFQVNNLTPLEIIICGPGSFDGNISVKNANLTVKDGATLLKPLQGGRNGETLTVDNATLKCDKYTISDFASLTLANGMGIIEPVRGYYNDQMQELEDETGAPAWGYLIRPLTDEELAVRSINADSSARTIYNVQGQRTGKLQRGVNVVIDENGRTRKQLVK